MASRLLPNYVLTIALKELSEEHFLTLAIRAAEQLDWNVTYTSRSGFIAYTKSNIASWNEEVTLKIENRIATLKSECAGNQLLDFGKNKSNIDALVAKISEFKNAYTFLEVGASWQELKVKSLVNEDAGQFPAVKRKRIKGFFGIFKPVEGYFVTPIILDINILVFLLMLISRRNTFSPDWQELVAWGAGCRPLMQQGQWWRLFSSAFMHLDLEHILMNMCIFVVIGFLLEPYLGKRKYLLAYLLTALASGAVSELWYHTLPFVGASGAILGMYGVYVALLSAGIVQEQARKFAWISIGILFMYVAVSGLSEGVNNSAHLSGFITGLIIGFCFVPGLKRPQTKAVRLLISGAITAVVLLFSFGIYFALAANVRRMESAETATLKTVVSMQHDDLDVNEALAMEYFALPATAPKERKLYYLKDHGLYYWKENIEYIDNFDKLELSSGLHEQNRKLKEYYQLRVKWFELMYKTIGEETDQYQSMLDYYGAQIEAIKP